MQSRPEILILIPARGGSKGIPQKNVTLLNGKPLIYYAIQNAKAVPRAHVVVATDDIKIDNIAGVYGIEVIKRPSETATDAATLDDVASYVVDEMEKRGRHFDVLITLQPTSPLLKKESLLMALDMFLSQHPDTIISASAQRHLMWKEEHGKMTPLYASRVNRQTLDPVFVENGAFVICRSSTIKETRSRIGEKVILFPVSDEESVDIDSANDWVLADQIMKRKKVAFITRGDTHIGMGHVYRSMTLASRLIDQRIRFFSHADSGLGIEKIRQFNYPLETFTAESELMQKLEDWKADIVINDILDTDIKYIKQLKKRGIFVVNFEDTGEGASHCDLLFNALYEWSGSRSAEYYGYQYECLRDDIYLYPIKTEVKKESENILIGFGGIDAGNATLKVLKSLDRLDLSGKTVHLVLGIGYQYIESLEEYLGQMGQKDRIVVHRDVPVMSKYLYDADLVISGNGRMVYEAVSIGTPLIVFSQNEREMTHTFPKICPGILYNGNIHHLTEKELDEGLALVQDGYKQRRRMNQALSEYALDIRNGLNRIVDLLWEHYDRSRTQLHSGEDTERTFARHTESALSHR